MLLCVPVVSFDTLSNLHLNVIEGGGQEERINSSCSPSYFIYVKGNSYCCILKRRSIISLG